jgi:hypothetical protein
LNLAALDITISALRFQPDADPDIANAYPQAARQVKALLNALPEAKRKEQDQTNDNTLPEQPEPKFLFNKWLKLPLNPYERNTE